MPSHTDSMFIESGTLGTDVSAQRKEAFNANILYVIIKDTLDGEYAVKGKNDKYLPIPNSVKAGKITDPYYLAYKTRALYYNVVAPTRDALVGQLNLRPPVIELPPQLEDIVKDITGEGMSLEELIQHTENHVVPYGRAGLISDFPFTENREVTRLDVERGVQPIIRFVEPWAIRNWFEAKVNNVKRLVLLVIEEAHEEMPNDSNYEVQINTHYRVYRLAPHAFHDGLCCSVQLFDEDNELIEDYLICNADGEPLREIPFECVGSENNDMSVDNPPFYNLSNINLAHYRNSADYEESAFLVGQPTPVYAGLPQEWVDLYFKDGVPFGCRASVTLPEGATAQLLQALPNTLAFEAMQHKEEQMIAIGAKLINPNQQVEKKEVEIQVEAASQKSVLLTIRNNVQAAIIRSLERCAAFIGGEGEIKLEINDNFDLTAMTAEEMRWLIEVWNNGGISFTEFRENLRRSGIAKLPDDEALTAIKQDIALRKLLNPEPESNTPVKKVE